MKLIIANDLKQNKHLYDTLFHIRLCKEYNSEYNYAIAVLTIIITGNITNGYDFKR